MPAVGERNLLQAAVIDHPSHHCSPSEDVAAPALQSAEESALPLEMCVSSAKRKGYFLVILVVSPVCVQSCYFNVESDLGSPRPGAQEASEV